VRRIHRAWVRWLMWLYRRVVYGPTYYDRWQSTMREEWDRMCWRRGGGTPVFSERRPVPGWLVFLP